jgi:hypothetical protein
MNGFAPQPGLWQEASSADGRVYYFNTQTKATQWTKPLDMMTSVEVTNILLSSIASADFVTESYCEFSLERIQSQWPQVLA